MIRQFLPTLKAKLLTESEPERKYNMVTLYFKYFTDPTTHKLLKYFAENKNQISLGDGEDGFLLIDAVPVMFKKNISKLPTV